MTSGETGVLEQFSLCKADIRLPTNAQTAYSCFLEKLDAWWPPEYRFSPEGVLGLEPLTGGSCYEDVEDGRRLQWGTIQKLEEGRKIVLSWQVSPKRLLIETPQQSGIVTIDFIDVEDGAQVNLVHSHFERYGDGWREYLRAMNSSAGWPYCLSKLKVYITRY
ncbi:hypothetical protein PsAD2_02393 [Pseudovibrio axinellae]|uniref:Activator of Hsp90 ATPase homologue 1/2-like C-terminal domain-containing protein n=1 Tax=Pseudovibrio axinellae TaxID=989403 RepID=A0A165YIP6_9HYPH|nr:SRPBCC family protein [Pseudovibrio axinellae]KZL18877.1 hypothetical protein PsAD2_02393 [Pseudovibrio axinellae]SEP89359.1 Uncharacterized conserved protein YndB, AHSA1/START domain [Pseudovibrio axinellae]